MTDTDQSEYTVKEILKHSLITMQQSRWIYIWTLVNFNQKQIQVFVEDKVKAKELEECVFEGVAVHL